MKKTYGFLASGLIASLMISNIAMAQYIWLAAIPVIGYGFAWEGHFFFEKNKPATFTYPFYSLASDFLLFFDLLRGKEKFS